MDRTNRYTALLIWPDSDAAKPIRAVEDDRFYSSWLSKLNRELESQVSALLLNSRPAGCIDRRTSEETVQAVAGVADGLTLAEATNLLDQLEQVDVPVRDVVFSPDIRVSVRWGD